MSDLEIRLLGAPEVMWRGQPATIERRITRILLYYLASQEGMVNRTRLVNLFWGHKDERSARTNLRQSLHRLRASFPGIKLLKEQGDMVGVNIDEIEVDLHQFIRNFDLVFPIANRIPASQPLPDEVYQKLLYLNGLWHGASFLGESVSPDSLELEEWISGIDDRLQPLRRWVLERLADHALASGSLQEALNFTNHALTNHEDDESLHKRVLMILLRMNRFGEAQGHYKKILSKFAKEGLELSTGFRQQFDQLVNPATRPRLSSEVNWGIYAGTQMPFVGRRFELDILIKQYLAGGAVFIFGESGQGKTRLLATFTNQAFPVPRTILARARAGESGLPYQPLVDALRQGVQPSEWLRLSGVWASHLSQLLPELSVLRSDLKPPLVVNPDQARAQLQEALRQLTLVIAQNQRLLLVLDDAQWSDEATQAALEYLISRPPFDKHALVAIAARVEEPNPGILRMHAHMVKDHAVKTIQLNHLQTGEIAQLIQSTLHISASPAIVEHLARDSGGNPLYLGEILTSLVARDKTELESEHLPTPENLTKFIQARLSNLHPETRRVFEAAAVLGYDFSLVELSGTSQCPPDQLSAALNELEESHLLRINPIQNEINKVRINFIHDKFREVQLQMVSPVRLPLLHRLAAKTLHSSAGENLDESAAVIAQHFEQAGDFIEAFHLWRRAGIHSLELFSITEADLAFNRAVAVLPYCGKQLDDEAIFRLFEVWREAHIARNTTSELKSLGNKQLGLGKERNSPMLLCSGHLTLADAAFTQNDFQTGLDQIQLAMEHISELDYPYLTSGVFLTQGVLFSMAAQLPAAKDALSKALAILGDLQDADPATFHRAGDINFELGMVETIIGWPAKGREYVRRALELHQKILDQRMVLASIIMAVGMNGLIAHYMGRFVEGAQTCRDMLEPAIQAGAWRAVGYLHNYIALNELAMGNMDEMLLHVEQAIQIGEQYERKEVYTFARRVMGDGLLWMQDFLNAREYFSLALAQNQDTFLTPDFQIHLGYCDVVLGNVEAGFRSISEAEKVCQNLGLGFFKEDANTAFFFYYANTGNWEACKERAKQCILSSGERKLNSIRIFAEYFLGLSLIQTGGLENGMQLLHQVAHNAQNTQNFWAELLSRQSIALLMKKTGQDPAAEIERIMVLLEHLEAHTQSQVFRDRFQKLRVYFLQGLDIPGLISIL